MSKQNVPTTICEDASLSVILLRLGFRMCDAFLYVLPYSRCGSLRQKIADLGTDLPEHCCRLGYKLGSHLIIVRPPMHYHIMLGQAIINGETVNVAHDIPYCARRNPFG